MAHAIEGIMGVSMDNLHEMVDVNTIIGDPIVKGDTTIIPISKVSFGFASGGSDLPSQAAEKFAGGAGAGVTVKPVGFIVIKPDGDVKLLELGAKSSPFEGVVDSIPGLIEKLKGMKGGKDEESAEDKPAKSERTEKPTKAQARAEAKVEKAAAKAEKAEARLSKAEAKVEAVKAQIEAEQKAEKTDG